MRRSDALNEQLQTALNSRVIIEQAKGKLAERLGLDMDQAFTLLRDHARSRNLRLSELAQAFIDGSEPLTGPTAARPAAAAPRRRAGTPPAPAGLEAHTLDLASAAARRRSSLRSATPRQAPVFSPVSVSGCG